MTFIPLFIDVRGLKVTVFGGGSVGTRRALEFSSAGAKVVVVASQFSHELEAAARAGHVELVRESLSPGSDVDRFIRGSFLVVIATSDSSLNSYLASRARELGVLVNNATEALEGNAVYPFTAEPIEGLKVAVTTLGLSGVAARRARDRIAECLGSDRYLALLLSVMAKFKVMLKESVSDPKVRVPLYFKVAEDQLFNRLIEQGDEEGALRRALEIARADAGGTSAGSAAGRS
ncbi:bifunctional precorrin-2 dehydrogenase/sirohydrochlorin ferrochelatase [Acidilobus sp. 7A]|uniref:precorrin-2 dehydrogenase/sirohydrochlorin ferrochelatase family protein n=1 Tax=Acidilobus sp. 7A TaxID=1577685 RepID=UPI001314B592|nr:bifunctional precorrin-2 dehydrogenase/sirohydrochlorin ferrochelatase [Acidilobus sp. 7A]